MTRRNGRTAPGGGAVADSDAIDRDRLVSRLGERENLLRSLLIDARDQLVRSKLRDSLPGDGRGSSPALESPGRRADGGEYAALRERIVAALGSALPEGACALVVSRGDGGLLALRGRVGEHFPAQADGRYAGHHPADSAAAIAELEARRTAGADFFVVPATELWWLEHYAGLTRHLEARYRRRVDAPETCVVFDLRGGAEAAPALMARSEQAPVETVPVEAVPVARESAGVADRRRSIAATTIISRNYLAQARVLADSFLEHEPDGRFYLLVVDRLPAGVDTGVPVTLVDPRNLDIPGFHEMCFKYGVVELSTAVKPYLLWHLLEELGEEEVVYLDPDILVERRLDELRDALADSSAALTPHILSPIPVDGKRPNEQDIMISGAYNLGFIALRRSPEARELLAWWKERLADGCRIDVPNGLFTDQKWIDLVPSLFPSAAIFRDPTYNVAFWNLHEREIGWDGRRFTVNGRPAAFFHVSGFDPREPAKLSKHQSRVEVEEGTPLARLLARYARRLLAAGYDATIGWEYGYERFADGVRVHPLLRQLYLNLSPEERGRFADPFASGSGTFLDWATGPGEKPGSLSRFLDAIYRFRYDLPLAFPDVLGRDRAAYLEWARRWGSAEMGYEPELVRDGEAIEPGAPKRLASAQAAPARRVEAKKGGGGGFKSSEATLEYRALVERVRDLARAVIPAGARCLVVNKGDYRLLELGGIEGWHFPQTLEGIYGGFYPGDSDLAIAHLEALREKGADHLLLPRTAFWWLDHYPGLRRHLETNYRLLARDEEACAIYDLRGAPAAPATPAGEMETAPARRAAAPAMVELDGAGGEITPPIVIYGAARSGTTYLVEILNRHPQIYVSDESRVFLWAHEMMQRVRWHERAAHGTVDEPGGRRISDRQRLGEYLRESLPRTLRGFYRELAPEAIYWGDKNPHYADPRDVGCLESIVELYPGARFLHLIRDGRDVVTSGMRGVWTDFDRVHEMWTSHLDLGRSFGRTLPANQYLELQYEELVRDDVGVAGQIFDFLEIERHPDVERFCRRQREHRTEICRPTRDLSLDPLRSDWSTFFSPRDRLRSLSLLGAHLVRFGYESSESLAAAREELLPLAAAEEPAL